MRKNIYLGILAVMLVGCATGTNMAPLPQGSETVQKCFDVPSPALSLHDIRLRLPWVFGLSVLIYQFFIRSILIALKTGSIRMEKEGRWKTFWDLFLNRRKVKNGASRGDEHEENDYFLPVCLGMIEMLFFPVFIALGRWDFIGAWIGIKTAAQWRQWRMSRPSYMRFLIGNALVVLASIFLSPFIQVNKNYSLSTQICYEKMSVKDAPNGI